MNRRQLLLLSNDVAIRNRKLRVENNQLGLENERLKQELTDAEYNRSPAPSDDKPVCPLCSKPLSLDVRIGSARYECSGDGVSSGCGFTAPWGRSCKGDDYIAKWEQKKQDALDSFQVAFGDKRPRSQDDDWYRKNIEPEIRPVVRLLRENGINTFASCGHEMYVQCEYTTDYFIQRLDNLLFNAGHRNYEINIRVERRDGHSFNSIEIKFPIVRAPMPNP